jgi:hypothetical protein
LRLTAVPGPYPASGGAADDLDAALDALAGCPIETMTADAAAVLHGEGLDMGETIIIRRGAMA